MQSDQIRIEITPSQHEAGSWWAYLSQEVKGDRRTVGKAFATNAEAWQWAQAFVERLRRPASLPSGQKNSPGGSRG